MINEVTQIEAKRHEVTSAIEACAVSLKTTHRLLGELVASSAQIDGALLVKISSAQKSAAEALQALGIF